MNRIVTNNLPDGTERLIATAEMLAEAQGVINAFPIEDVIVCPSDLDGSALYEVWARIGDKLDVVMLYAREAAPEVGGTLELLQMAKGGHFATWLSGDGKRSGAGYTEAGLPAAWGKPTPPSIGMTEKQIRAFGGGS